MGYHPLPNRVRCPGCGSLKQEPRFRHWFSMDVRLECACGVAGKWKRWDDREEVIVSATEGWSGAFGFPGLPRVPSGGSASERKTFRCDACPDHPLPPRDFGGGIRL